MMDRSQVGQRLRLLRQQMGVSARALAQQAGITPAMVSYIENGKSSPSVVTLEKLLAALHTNLADFFGAARPAPTGPVYPRESMQLIADAERAYTLIFPPGAGIGVELLDEALQPGQPRPAFETLKCDVAGYVLSGSLTLEVQGEALRELRPGDAFYVPAGVTHRGFATGAAPVRLITASLAPQRHAPRKPWVGRARRPARAAMMSPIATPTRKEFPR